MNITKGYTIKKLSSKKIKRNWSLQKNCPPVYKWHRHINDELFYHGWKYSCLKDFINDNYNYDNNFVIYEHIYYLQYPIAFQIDSISYPILVAGAVKHFLLTELHTNTMSDSFWTVVLTQLLSPVFHTDILKMLK